MASLPQVGRQVSSTPAQRPPQTRISGRLIALEPTTAAHSRDLFSAVGGHENASLWAYMLHGPFDCEDSFRAYLENRLLDKNSVFYTLIEPASQKAVGHFALLHIDIPNRVVEIGHVIFSPTLQRSTAATEAFYLLAKLVFDDLGFRRYEWKCNNLNTASRNAATRLGFSYEGLFRQHMIVKGHNRDSAWFSILDSEWPAIRDAYEKWLQPSNFDSNGKQIQTLASMKRK
ncbi:hypothetical protein LOZ36_003164 [Ophidiomyces ophidiicola]|nr:hypothetical protein LOZ36_003164 [Ophidiomyces ophidiicola]